MGPPFAFASDVGRERPKLGARTMRAMEFRGWTTLKESIRVQLWEPLKLVIHSTSQTSKPWSTELKRVSRAHGNAEDASTGSDLLGASFTRAEKSSQSGDFSASAELAGLKNAQRPDPAICTLVQRNLDIDAEISQYFLQHVA